MLGLAYSVSAENWPAWRGPQGTGVCSEKNLPLHWSTNDNVRWRVPLPERGNSTPIVWGQRVFVTQAIEQENRRTLMCFDRANGKLLWQHSLMEELGRLTFPNSRTASPIIDQDLVVTRGITANWGAQGNTISLFPSSIIV